MNQAEQSKQQISVGYIRNLSEFYGPRMIFIEGMIIITLILVLSYESFHEMNLSVIVCSKPFDKLLIIPLLLFKLHLLSSVYGCQFAQLNCRLLQVRPHHEHFSPREEIHH